MMKLMRQSRELRDGNLMNLKKRVRGGERREGIQLRGAKERKREGVREGVGEQRVI